MIRWLVRFAAVFAIRALVEALSGFALLRSAASPHAQAAPMGLIASALVAAVAVAVAARLPGRGAGRAATLFALLFGPQLNNNLELLIFPLDLHPRLLPLLVLHAAIVAAGTALALNALVPAGPPGPSCWPTRRSIGGWIARVLACDAAYIVVYLAAGMMAWPFVRAFYAARAMPAMGAIVAMQVGRGLVFTALLALAAWRLRGGRGAVSWLGALAFTTFAGWALLIPNPFMPDFVRHAHMVEVGVSNFVFALLVLWLLTARAAPEAEASVAHGAPRPAH